MKAIVQYEYGPPEVLEFRDVDMPVAGDDDVLIRVQASSVNALEWHMMTGVPFLVHLEAGFSKPKRPTLGADVAGRVEAVGKNVTRFQPGDDVFGDVGSGAYAEYVTGSERSLALKPDNVTFEQAAAVPVAGLTALQGLRDKGQIQSGQHVLINGASGGVGTFAVQIAKSLGAEVTAVCSTKNVDAARSLGADHVIDYTQEDFVQSGRRYDLMFDLPGNRSLADCKRVLKSNGTYLLVGGSKRRWVGPLPRLFRAKLAFLVGNRRMDWLLAKANNEDLGLLAGLLESGEVTPVIERRYELSDVPEALRRFGDGHAQGKTVITV
ncbi:MAG: NAD(P)-dependent alcohol dehydrogenase [Acidimicrobiia bacterium]